MCDSTTRRRWSTSPPWVRRRHANLSVGHASCQRLRSGSEQRTNFLSRAFVHCDERYDYACVCCGRRAPVVSLDLGHLLPRKLAEQYGFLDELIDSGEANTQCALHWRRGALLRYGPARAKVWTISGAEEARDELETMLRGTFRALFAEYKSLSVAEQMEWDGEWVPRATLEKIGVIPADEIAESVASDILSGVSREPAVSRTRRTRHNTSVLIRVLKAVREVYRKEPTPVQSTKTTVTVANSPENAAVSRHHPFETTLVRSVMVKTPYYCRENQSRRGGSENDARTRPSMSARFGQQSTGRRCGKYERSHAKQGTKRPSTIRKIEILYRSEQRAESSAAIRDRVLRARKLQQERFAGKPRCRANAEMSHGQLKTHCKLDSRGRNSCEGPWRNFI